MLVQLTNCPQSIPVLEEFPGIAFTKVSELLVERWRALPLEEHIKYEKLAKEIDNKRKSNAAKISGEHVTSIKRFVNKNMSSKNGSKMICQRPHRREIALDVSINKLQENNIPVRKELE
jgi:hypothetical protein